MARPEQDTVGPVITNLAVTPNRRWARTDHPGGHRYRRGGADAAASGSAAPTRAGNGNDEPLDGSFSGAVEGSRSPLTSPTPTSGRWARHPLGARPGRQRELGAVQTVEFVKSDRFGRTLCRWHRQRELPALARALCHRRQGGRPPASPARPGPARGRDNAEITMNQVLTAPRRLYQTMAQNSRVILPAVALFVV